MKFSYSLLKKLVPALKSKKEALDVLTFKIFETDDLGGDTLDVGVSPNRFSDAASHFGLAKEIAAVLGTKSVIPDHRLKSPKNAAKKISIKINDIGLCPRYMAAYFSDLNFGQTPKYIVKALGDCGLRPINPVVDIMNYVMLETGQPLHAFDFDKLSQRSGVAEIFVRHGRKDEKIVTLDGRDIELDPSVLVIADSDKPLAIAGIKGGKDAEVDENTKRIIVEAANFERNGIYKASQRLKIITDASSRFSHDISPELPVFGLGRAAGLLSEVCGAKLGEVADIKNFRKTNTIIAFSPERINDFLGSSLSVSEMKKYLSSLGFSIKSGKRPGTFLAIVPLLRPDVETFEDIAEEVARLYGFNNLASKSPKIFLSSSGYEDQITVRDKTDRVLISAGFSRVRNYSFVSGKELESISSSDADRAIEVENPISDFFRFMRPNLAIGLRKNIESNLRFFEEVKIFEIGNVFSRGEKGISEKTNLGIAVASKKGSKNLFEIKGAVDALFRKIGISDFRFSENADGSPFFRSGMKMNILSGEENIGFIGQIADNWNGYEAAIAEIDFNALVRLAEEENTYLPIPKYPSSMRDISILVSPYVKIGDIMQAIQQSDPKLIWDVDLIDEYAKNLNDNRALTFRIIFQAEDRTLTEAEVNSRMENITNILQEEFKATIR